MDLLVLLTTPPVAHHSYHHRAYHMVRCHVGMDRNIKLKGGII